MAAEQWNPEFEKGDSFVIDIYVEDENGVVNLSGHNFSWIFYDKPNGVVRYTASTDNGKIVIDGPAGIIRVKIPSSDIDTFTWTRSYHEFQQWIDPLDKEKWFKGNTKVIV